MIKPLYDADGHELTPGCAVSLADANGKRRYGWVFAGAVNELTYVAIRRLKRGTWEAYTRPERVRLVMKR